jgi:hypothetical protein
MMSNVNPSCSFEIDQKFSLRLLPADQANPDDAIAFLALPQQEVLRLVTAFAVKPKTSPIFL